MSIRKFEAHTGEDSRYQPSCSSRAADGLIRGGLVGLAWGFCFHPIEELSVTGWVIRPEHPSNPQIPAIVTENVLPRMRSMGQASMMFGLFLATFSGVSCASEKVIGRKHWVNIFFGGSAAGVLLAIRNRSPRNVAITAVSTGILTSSLFFLTQ